MSPTPWVIYGTQTQLGKKKYWEDYLCIEVVQNPIRARCCGFGEKDRRPIDPPPILQLSSKDQDGNPIDLK